MISRRELFALFKINVPSLLAFFVAHSDEHQHDVSIQISEISVTWNLARVFTYLPSFFPNCGFIYWMVLFFILIYFESREVKPGMFPVYKKIPGAGVEHSSYLTTPTPQVKQRNYPCYSYAIGAKMQWMALIAQPSNELDWCRKVSRIKKEELVVQPIERCLKTIEKFHKKGKYRIMQRKIYKTSERIYVL